MLKDSDIIATMKSKNIGWAGHVRWGRKQKSTKLKYGYRSEKDRLAVQDHDS